MLNTDIADVIVVGAGPAGSRLAWRLVQQGHDVILIEKRQTLGEPVCCTGIVSPQCFADFEIDPDLVLRRFSGARIHSPSGEIIHIERSTIQAMTIDRAAFDREMTEKARVSGARLLLGAVADHIKILPDRVIVRISQGQEQHQFVARAVVIAAGLTQQLTTKLGLGSIRDFAVGVQLDIEGAGINEVEVFLGKTVAPGFFAWLVPTSPGRAKLGMMVRRHPVEHIQRLTSMLTASHSTLISNGRPVCRPIPLRRLDKTYGDRLLVVGDAAGQVKTTTGGGLYYGLLCADLAADTLHNALLQDALQARTLEGYEREWRRRLSRDMFLGQLARNIFLQRMGDRQLDALIKKTSHSNLLAKLIEEDRLSFDWHGPAILKWVVGLLLV